MFRLELRLDRLEVHNKSFLLVSYFLQIRTEEMDLIAERGIAAHYSGREFVTGLVGSATPSGKSSRGKTVCLNNANIALRVCYLALSMIEIIF